MFVLNTKQFMVRLFLLIIACFLVSIAEGTAKTKKHYNVILIMADDSAVDNYGCYGSTFFTPPPIGCAGAYWSQVQPLLF
jgi:hypothetical protein